MDENADSGSEIDMDAAMDSISSDLFGKEPEEEVAEEVSEEVTEAVEEKTEEVKAEETEEKEESRAAPQSWRKEMHEFWKGVDPAVQDYIEQREQQMHEGLEKDRGDANLGRTMRDAMEPYSQLLESQGIEGGALARNLFNAHARLSTADDAGKLDMIKQIANSYGLELDGSKQEIDPVMRAMQDKVNNIEQRYTAAEQAARQAEEARIASDVEAFILDPKHEFFDEVSPEMISFIDGGKSLEDAYNLALKANPVTYQQTLDQQIKEAVEKAKAEWGAEAEKTRKAKSANVRGRDTVRASTEPKGTIEDTLLETYNEIQSRSH